MVAAVLPCVGHEHKAVASSRAPLAAAPRPAAAGEAQAQPAAKRQRTEAAQTREASPADAAPQPQQQQQQQQGQGQQAKKAKQAKGTLVEQPPLGQGRPQGQQQAKQQQRQGQGQLARRVPESVLQPSGPLERLLLAAVEAAVARAELLRKRSGRGHAPARCNASVIGQKMSELGGCAACGVEPPACARRVLAGPAAGRRSRLRARPPHACIRKLCMHPLGPIACCPRGCPLQQLAVHGARLHNH